MPIPKSVIHYKILQILPHKILMEPWSYEYILTQAAAHLRFTIARDDGQVIQCQKLIRSDMLRIFRSEETEQIL